MVTWVTIQNFLSLKEFILMALANIERAQRQTDINYFQGDPSRIGYHQGPI